MLIVMEKASLSLLLVALVVVSLPLHTNAGKYKKGDRIQLYVNKVGPYYNPQETYHYYSLPVCTPDKVEHRSLTLGEVLDGDRMAISLYQVNFNISSSHKELCTRELSNKDIEKLQAAIEDLYYFEFVFDDLTMRGFIGHLEEGSFLPHHHKTFLWTHLHFSFSYNNKEIIEANVTTTGATPLSLDEIEGPLRVTFTYSTSWFKTTKKRSDTNSQQLSFFPKSMEIHWLSIVNSVVLVCLLLGFVTLILMRVLHNDFSRYNINDEDNDDLEQDNYGWKIISNDVFRFPPNKNLLCAILGVGSQFLFLSLSLIILALLGMFNVHRHHAMNSAGILLYAFTSCVAGYVSARLYRKMNGENWVWNVILTACLFAVPFLVVWGTVNTVALYHHSTQALPFTTILLITVIWMIIGFPLTVLGGILGKNSTLPRFDAPCRTKNIPREIPHLTWYHTLPIQMIVGGFLPFSSISVELYYIFATVWGREAYTLYGILLVVFLILISVTCCISITLTYFVLSAEDYRWWWRSVFNAGSTGLFVFAYALFYFYKRSHMYGTLQTLEYFGYTLLACYIFFLMMGTVSFFSSLTFVQYMYRNLKTD